MLERIQNLRSSERRQFHGAVQMSWRTRSGEAKVVRGKCLDLSDQGARIESEQAIELRTSVYLQAPAFGVLGNATVRYCRRSGLKHVVGLMFSASASQADRGRQRCLDHAVAIPEERTNEG